MQNAGMRVFLRVLALATAMAGMARAGEPVLQHSDSIASIEAQVFCSPVEEGVHVPAPETALGYVIETDAELNFRQTSQQVTATIGMAFGVQTVTTRDIAKAKLSLSRPGGGKPDVWYVDFTAGAEQTQYFSFDFEQELVPGPWVFEAWDGEELLYRVGFSVLPAGTLPEGTLGCGAVS